MSIADQMAGDVSEDPTADARPDVIELGEEMAKLKTEIDSLEDQRKEKQARYDEIRKERLPLAMQEAGMVNDQGKGSFTLRTGGKVYLRTDLYASVRKADQENFHEWLRGAGHGDLIRETVYHQTLKAWAREQIEQGADLPEFIRTHYETSATIRKG